jgi:eukaryotic-like serine/threonine-protein kinase
VIILSLLHPVKQIPVQVWTFPKESVIRIGRATDNQVILYSAVVSRHHVELRRVGLEWEVVNLGTNGTYLNGKRITQTMIADGAVIRLARSGPNIQVRMGEAALKELSETIPASRITYQRQDLPLIPTEITGHTPQTDEIAEPEADDHQAVLSPTEPIST